MNHSPLQLKHYFFSKASILAQPKGDPAAINGIETKIGVGRINESPDDYLVSLTVRLVPLEENNPCYLGEFVAIGVFAVHPGYPKEGRDKLVGVNGASVLYGAIREMVANLSARGPWPMLTLVAMNFADDFAEPNPGKSPGKPEAPQLQPVMPES